jgi:hypothetical protein
MYTNVHTDWLEHSKVVRGDACRQTAKLIHEPASISVYFPYFEEIKLGL